MNDMTHAAASLASLRDELRAAGAYMLDNQLAWGNAGNISARAGGDRCLITASGTELGRLKPDDLVECAFAAVSQAHARRPSKELPMHRAVYEARPEINAVLHASPFYSTLVACSAAEIPASWFVESMYYLERIARVAYHDPGSEALGAAVRAQATRANVLLLENHGVLVYDTSVREALMGLQTLELVCRMSITARSAGITMRSLTPDVVDHFLTRSGYRPRRQWSE
jgi:3-dehydro-4-phosphotetronate decarboxylase